MGVMEPLLQAKTEEGVCSSLLPLKDVFFCSSLPHLITKIIGLCYERNLENGTPHRLNFRAS